ncbi:MAG: futalosine hydrolase [Bacteroidota bacterium]
MKILLLSATPFEIAPAREWLAAYFEEKAPHHFTTSKVSVEILYGGVGLPATAFSLGSVLAVRPFDLAIQAGIGGAIDAELTIGDVVEIIADRFGDLGAETATGGFLDLEALGLQERQSGIFAAGGQIINPSAKDNDLSLKKARGISVNRVHGTEESINQLRQRYPEAQVESMEGAAFFYACRYHQLPMLQIRAISNYVEPRNREAWDIPLAVVELNKLLKELLSAFANAANP